MTIRLSYLLVIFIFLFSSCEQSQDSNSNQGINTNRLVGDSALFTNIIFLDNNKDISGRGFANERPTWANCYNKSDSLYVYLPSDKFQNSCLYIGFDSSKAVQGKRPDYEICDLRRSCIITMKPEFYRKYDTLIGALKCWDSIKNVFEYYPFVRPLK